MTGITTYLSVLALNVNGLNSPIKRHCLMNWIKKEDPTICSLQETHLTNRNNHRLRMKGWKKIHSILIKGEIDQKKITIINLYAPNFIKHTLKDLKAYINSNTVVMGDFNTTLSSIDRSSKQKINKEILDLKYTIDQMDLVYVYRKFHPTSTQYTFFSAAYETFSKIDHILGHKASLRKYKKIEITPCILSDHSAKN
jgi:exonuclease III